MKKISLFFMLVLLPFQFLYASLPGCPNLENLTVNMFNSLLTNNIYTNEGKNWIIRGGPQFLSLKSKRPHEVQIKSSSSASPTSSDKQKKCRYYVGVTYKYRDNYHGVTSGSGLVWITLSYP